MALINLDKNDNPVLVIENSMDYVTKADERKIMEKKTAAINVIRNALEAKKLGLQQSTLAFKQNINGEEKWENYIVKEKVNGGGVVLSPLNNKELEAIEVNVGKKGNSEYFYFSDKGASAEFANTLVTATYQDKAGFEHHRLEARVNINNKDLAAQLKEKGDGAVAVVSKDKVEITTKAELSAKKQEREAAKQQETPAKNELER